MKCIGAEIYNDFNKMRYSKSIWTDNLWNVLELKFITTLIKWGILKAFHQDRHIVSLFSTFF